MFIYAIDPGLYGAVVGIDKDGKLVDYYSFPRIEEMVGDSGGKFGKKKSKKVVRLNLPKIASWFYELKKFPHWVIEDVSASPQMGVTSSFKFGHNLGVIEGMISYFNLGQEEPYKVKPSVWTRMTKNTHGKDAKERSYEYFKINHPEYYKVWKKEFNKEERRGLIDAFLMAKWYWRNVFEDEEGWVDL